MASIEIDIDTGPAGNWSIVINLPNRNGIHHYRGMRDDMNEIEIILKRELRWSFGIKKESRKMPKLPPSVFQINAVKQLCAYMKSSGESPATVALAISMQREASVSYQQVYRWKRAGALKKNEAKQKNVSQYPEGDRLRALAQFLVSKGY